MEGFNVSTLVPVSYNDTRVLTTEQLAEVYECETVNIRKNFKTNVDRFVEGKHYFKIEGEELNNLRVTFGNLQISPKTRSLMLWTRQGASRHCKMLGTDKAWDMFDILEETYFNKESLLPKDYPSALRALADQYEKNQKLLTENKVMKPKAEYFDCLVDRNLLTNFRTTAKELHLKQKQFIDWLLENKFIYRDQKGSLQPYSEYADYFHIKDVKSAAGSWVGTQTFITPKGKEAFRLMLGVE